jgi:2-polyprenyl-3-methyl-5-hydroxy-6-metoxy-1,4-benzoquinol methylase
VSKKIQYFFEEITHCEMCGESTASHKILGQRINCSQGLSPKNKTGISITVKKCTNCKLIYSSPQPTPFDISDHYGTPPEDYWQPSYFNWTEGYFESEIATVKSLLHKTENSKALDIGAGLGKAMISLEKAGFDVYGFEPSLPFYKRAIEKMNISPDKLKLGMIENVDYAENYFDFISFGAVVEHLYHPAESIEKALKWLKPKGLIHIEVPNSKHLIAKIVNAYYKLRGANCVTHLSPMHSPYHMYEFDLKSFHELGKKLNFEVVKYEYFVCEIFFMPKFLHPIFNYLMKKTNTGLQLVVWLQKK